MRLWLYNCDSIALGLRNNFFMWLWLYNCYSIALGLRNNFFMWLWLYNCDSIALGLRNKFSMRLWLYNCDSIALGLRNNFSMRLWLYNCDSIALGLRNKFFMRLWLYNCDSIALYTIAKQLFSDMWTGTKVWLPLFEGDTMRWMDTADTANSYFRYLLGLDLVYKELAMQPLRGDCFMLYRSNSSYILITTQACSLDKSYSPLCRRYPHWGSIDCVYTPGISLSKWTTRNMNFAYTLRVLNVLMYRKS